MNNIRFLSMICFFSGVFFIVYGVLNGDVEVGVFFIVPFLVGSGIPAFLGFILIFIAFFLFMCSSFDDWVGAEDSVFGGQDAQLTEKTSVSGGGVVLIGPIPIVFGSNWRIAVVMMVLAIVLIGVSLLFFYY